MQRINITVAIVLAAAMMTSFGSIVAAQEYDEDVDQGTCYGLWMNDVQLCEEMNEESGVFVTEASVRVGEWKLLETGTVLHVFDPDGNKTHTYVGDGYTHILFEWGFVVEDLEFGNVDPSRMIPNNSVALIVESLDFEDQFHYGYGVEFMAEFVKY